LRKRLSANEPMKRSPLLTVLLAIALFVSGFIVRGLFFDDPVASDQRVAESIDNNKRLDEEIARLQTEKAQLENQLARLEEAQTEPSAATQAAPKSFRIQSGGAGTAAISLSSAESPFSDDRFQKMMQAQVDRQLDIYSARLNLSDQQRSKLQEMMLLRFMQMGRRLGGDDAQDDTPRITQNDIDDLAAEILNEPQLDEYNEMRNQEIASRSEMMATAQLSQIAPQLGLSEDQKNQAYGIYYEQSLDLGSGISDPVAYQESREQANERIMEILDDKQKAIFETINQQQGPGGMANFTVIAE